VALDHIRGSFAGPETIQARVRLRPVDDLETAPAEPATESEAAAANAGSPTRDAGTPTRDSTSRVLIVLFIACILALVLVSQLASVVLAGGGGGCGGG
jgi:hypothetical protein